MDYDQLFKFIARTVVLFTAMPVHECAHGLMADRLGDPTPRRQGRLSLNPLRHLDPLGSMLLFLTGFGWARPVMVDPRNMRNPRRDMAMVSIAGPLSNILLALLITIAYKVLLGVADIPALRTSNAAGIAIYILYSMILINLYLAVFNLLPVPPLDGSKFFGALLPDGIYFNIMRYERVIGGVLFALIFFTDVIQRPLQWLAGGLMRMLDILTIPIDLLFFR